MLTVEDRDILEGLIGRKEQLAHAGREMKVNKTAERLEAEAQAIRNVLTTLDAAEAKVSKYRDKLEEFRLYAHDPEIRNEARAALKEEK